MTQTFDLRIDSIAAGGDGIGRHDGVVVFVPRTAPGDIAHVEATQSGRLMRGRSVRLVEASPERVDPACAHYTADTCGGCQLQHLTYESQLQAKSGIIRDSLTRIGRLSVDAPIVEPSELPWRYRRKLTLFVRQRGAGRIAGMHPFDKPDAVFEVRDCHITDERVMQCWKQVIARADLLPAGPELRVSVRMLPTGFAVVVEGGTDWNADAFLEGVPAITELWWKPEGKGRQRMTPKSDAAGASFAQVNARVAERLVQHVASLVAKLPHATAIDAYAGTGDIAVMLAGLGARVTAIEIDQDAADLCRTRLPADARVLSQSVESALAKALPADLVVLNPPRAGIAASVADLLQAQSPKLKAVLYVSCDPGTLARDIKRMNRYRLASVRGFDMFPQTAHVETVCELVPAA